MGGSSSKTTISDTANLLSSNIISSSVTCVSTGNQSNVLDVSGNGNIIKGIDQSTELIFKSGCLDSDTTASTVLQTLNSTTAASQAAEQQALAGFLDDSTQSISDKISNNVTNTLTISNMSTCMNNVNANNVIDVHGSNNVIDGVKQISDIDILQTCAITAAQQSNNATSITNMSNMAQQYKSDSLFEPFTAAFQAIMEAGILGIVFVIFLVTCIVIAYKYVKLNRQSKSVYKAPNGSAVL
jgi:hypothetical protein